MAATVVAVALAAMVVSVAVVRPRVLWVLPVPVATPETVVSVLRVLPAMPVSRV
jgi:hypothetical protein